MKVSFVGNFGARPEVANTVLAKVTEDIEPTILFDIGDTQRLIPALAEAEIVVSHIWKQDFPQAPRLKLLQSPAAGLDLIDLPSLPGGVAVCNVVGHEQAIAEYVMMTTLALSHRCSTSRPRSATAAAGPAAAPAADRCTARSWAAPSGLSATARSAARSPGVRPPSAAASSPSIAARSPTTPVRRKSIRWVISTACCRSATWS